MTLTGDTTNATDKFTTANSGNCAANTYMGADLIYAVTPGADGTLTATLTTDYTDTLLHVRTACPGPPPPMFGPPTDDVACDYTNGKGQAAMITLSVTTGTTYYVAADSWGKTSGTFTLVLSLN